MLTNFKDNLEKLEHSFAKKALVVKEVSHALENDLINIKKKIEKENINNQEFSSLLLLIKKL